MKIINTKINDIKFIKVTPPYEESFIFLANRSNMGYKKKGLENTYATFAYSGMMEDACVIVSIEIEYEGSEADIMDYRINIENKLKAFVRNLAKQLELNIE